MRRHLEVAIALISACGDPELNLVASKAFLELMADFGQDAAFEVVGCLSSLADSFARGWARSQGREFDEFFPEIAARLTHSCGD